MGLVSIPGRFFSTGSVGKEALACQVSCDLETGDRGWMHIVLEVETEVTLYCRLIVCVPPNSLCGNQILRVKAFRGVAVGR